MRTKPTTTAVALLLFVASATAGEPPAGEPLILPGAKLYDVTRPDSWGGDVPPATADDPSDDDSLAINAALKAAAAEIGRIRPAIEADWQEHEHAVYQQLVFVPEGKFHLESPIVFPRTQAYPQERWELKERFLWLRGAGRDRTTLGLKPATGIGLLGSEEQPQAFVQVVPHDPMTYQGNDNYLLWVTDCAIDVPSDQTHTVGLSFGAANMGGVRRVALRAQPGGGAVGLGLVQRNNGPALIDELIVEGFDRGIEVVDPWGEGFALTNITLRNQNAGGVALSVADKQIGIENLVIEQREPDVTPILLHDDEHPNVMHGGFPQLTLIGAEIHSTEPTDLPAIRIERGHSYLRHVKTDGYDEAIIHDHGAKRTFAAGEIDEYVSVHGKTDDEAANVIFTTEDAPPTSLHLPIRQPPSVAHEAAKKLAQGDWTKLSHEEIERGKTAVDTSWVIVDTRGAADDSDLLQTALDSGARFVGLLNHEPVTVSRTMRVNAHGGRKVELIHGAMSEIECVDVETLFRLDSGSAPSLTIEGLRIAARDRLEADYLVFENRSNRTVSFQDLMVDASRVYRNNETAVGSDVFFNNVCFVSYGKHSGRLLVFDRQHVWARQFDVERLKVPSAEPLVVNRGGTLWSMSQKFGEHHGVFVKTEDGGKTELLSTFFNTSRSESNAAEFHAPHFVVSGDDSAFSLVGQERIRAGFDEQGRAQGELPHAGEFGVVVSRDGQRRVIEGTTLPTYQRSPDVDPLADRSRRNYEEKNCYRVAGLLRVGAAGDAGIHESRSRPNVLFIVIDDMNDYAGCLGGHPDAITPAIDRLAAQGMLLTNAHCPSPVCNPSRVAFLTGVAPWKSGIHHHTDPWVSSEYLEEQRAEDLLRCYRRNGYEVLTAGKIFHSKPHNVQESWDEQGGRMGGFFSPKSEQFDDPFQGLKNQHERAFHWGPVDWSGFSDIRIADWFVERLNRDYDKPFLMAYGCSRPHVPLTSPPEFVRLFDRDKIVLPVMRDNELNDLPWMARQASVAGWQDMEGGYLHQMIEKNVHRDVLLNYLAACAFVDAQIGRVLKALENSPHAKNTMVVLVSDHGWGLGERRHVQKWGLWDDTTRVPFIVKAPGLTRPGTRSDAGVTLTDLYPTLIEVCNLQPPPQLLDGASLLPLLRDPKTRWERPAVMASGTDNFGVRTPRWRYNRWSDGSEELYDHRKDPDELDNVAGVPANEETKRRLARWLPMHTMPSTASSHQLPITLRKGDSCHFHSIQPGFRDEAWTIRARIGPRISDGVILHHNGNFAGYGIYVQDGKLMMTVMDVERPLQWDRLFPQRQTIVANKPLEPGKAYSIVARLESDGQMVLVIDGEEVARRPGRLLSIHPVGSMTCGKADEDYLPIGKFEPPFDFSGDIESVTVSR